MPMPQTCRGWRGSRFVKRGRRCSRRRFIRRRGIVTLRLRCGEPGTPPITRSRLPRQELPRAAWSLWANSIRRVCWLKKSLVSLASPSAGGLCLYGWGLPVETHFSMEIAR